MNRKRSLAALIIVASVLMTGVGVAAAQSTDTPGPIEDNTTYYDDENASVNQSEWIPGDGNATAPAMLDLFARIPGMFIGTGEMDASGTGFEGILLTALVVGASTLFAVAGAGVGIIAGSIIGMVVAFALTTIGLLPVWMQPLLLFTVVGVPASAALLRVFRR